MSGEASGAVIRVVYVEDDERLARLEKPRRLQTIRGIGDLLTPHAP